MTRRDAPRPLAILALAALFLAAPPAAGHGAAQGGDVLPPGSYLPHMTPWNVQIAPGEEANKTLAYAGTPLPEDWLLVFRAVVQGGPIAASLHDDAPFATWEWDEGVHQVTTRQPHTGYPVLRLNNTGSENATVSLYFDHTCDCTAKFMPGPEGPLLFNTEAVAGEAVRFNFTIVPLPADLSAPTEPFPGEVDVLVRRVQADEAGETLTPLAEERHHITPTPSACRGISHGHGCFDVAFVAPEDGRQVLLMDLAHHVPDWVLQVWPVVEVQDAHTGNATPPAGLAALLAALAGLAVAARRR